MAMLKNRLRQREQVQVLDPEAAYALWAPTYSPAAHTKLMELEEPAVLAMLPELRGLSALDLACGSGRYLRVLIDNGVRDAVGLDISTAMLARARDVSARLVRADIRAIPFPDFSFDAIVCGLAIGHVEDLIGAIREMSRVLVTNGIVVYSDFHPFASMAGWQRTFVAPDGRKYAARHHTYLYADHQAACSAAGLIIEDIREPRIDFEHEWRGCPAVMIIRARKLG